MNRYPLWINLLVGFALLIGIVYTLPNFFGEVPAIQVSAAKSTQKVDSDLQKRVETALTSAGIANDGMSLDATSLKVRFADTDTQYKAQGVVQKELGEDFVVALNLVSRSPRALTAIGALPMYLGLDLRGGVHFLLQVDMPSALTKKLDGAGSSIRGLLRDKRIAYSGIVREGQVLQIKFRDAAARDKARKEIESTSPELALNEQEQGGEFRLAATLKPEELKRTQDLALQQNIATLRNRVNELGVAEPIIQQQGADRIVVQLPGVQDTARAKELLGRTASLELRLVEAHASDPAGRDYDPQKIADAQKGNVPFGTELFVDRHGKVVEPLLLSQNVIITGERLTNAA
ncbi:MAG: protein translocase subunit SecD, partial [Burkholderiales bacterium]